MSRRWFSGRPKVEIKRNNSRGGGGRWQGGGCQSQTNIKLTQSVGVCECTSPRVRIYFYCASVKVRNKLPRKESFPVFCSFFELEVKDLSWLVVVASELTGVEWKYFQNFAFIIPTFTTTLSNCCSCTNPCNDIEIQSRNLPLTAIVTREALQLRCRSANVKWEKTSTLLLLRGRETNKTRSCHQIWTTRSSLLHF